MDRHLLEMKLFKLLCLTDCQTSCLSSELAGITAL